AQRILALAGALARAGVDTLELSTADDLVEAIVRFADMRKRRVRSSGAARVGGGRMTITGYIELTCATTSARISP
ncbi:hypothetical protein, partial [Xylella fastidiosa]|uniref:hypothetical protein n=1 Tax=Xylella fastidiosa TaxID=2371 RepID=UPI001930FD5D